MLGSAVTRFSQSGTHFIPTAATGRHFGGIHRKGVYRVSPLKVSGGTLSLRSSFNRHVHTVTDLVVKRITAEEYPVCEVPIAVIVNPNE